MRKLIFSYPLVLFALSGCAQDNKLEPNPSGDQLEDLPPTTVSLVVSAEAGQFVGPKDAVASPDGKIFYFSAFDTSEEVADESDEELPSVSKATIYQVGSDGGSLQRLISGPPLVHPDGLLAACDGASLYVIDSGFDLDGDGEGEGGTMYRLDLSTKELTEFAIDGVARAAGAALSMDCNTLYVSGQTANGEATVVTLDPDGGATTELIHGEPLEAPSGIYVDKDRVAWVMDLVPSETRNVTLWAVSPSGEATAVAGNIQTGQPAGVSLNAAGGTAVVPGVSEDGIAQLLTIQLTTGETTVVLAEGAGGFSGIRTAREAPVFVLVGETGIYKAE